MISLMVNSIDCGSPDAKEFISLLAAHSQSIYRYIYTLVPNPDQAQDIYQEAVLTLWEKFGEYRANEPFLPWAYRFAYFKVLAQRKSNRLQPTLLDDDVLEILAEEQVQELSAVPDYVQSAQVRAQCASYFWVGREGFNRNPFQHPVVISACQALKRCA